MNFLEAVAVSREKGYKIQRESWSDLYIQVNQDNFTLDDWKGEDPTITSGDILANDWQIKTRVVTLQELGVGDKFINNGLEWRRCNTHPFSENVVYAVRTDVWQVHEYALNGKVVTYDV
jgi:hypothetical protein